MSVIKKLQTFYEDSCKLGINLNYRTLSGLCMDLKVMPRLNKGYKNMLCIIDEVPNYLITVLTHQSRSEEICDSLIENVISKYCVPDYIIMDQDSAFMSSLINYLFQKLDIKIKTLATYIHQFLQAEHGIKSLSTILTKCRSNVAKIFTSSYIIDNTLNSSNLANYSL